MSVNKKIIKELETYLDILIKETYIPKDYNVEEFSEYRLVYHVYDLLDATKDHLESAILNKCFGFYLQEMKYRVTGEGIVDLVTELFLFLDLYINEVIDESIVAGTLNKIQFSADSKLTTEEIKEFHTSFFAGGFIESFESLKAGVLESSFESTIEKSQMLGKVKTTSEDPLTLYKNVYKKIINCVIYKEAEQFYLAIIFETFRKNIEEKRINARIASDMFVAELKDYLRYKYQSKNVAKEVQQLLTETDITLVELKLIADSFEHNPLDVKKSEVDFFASLPPLKIPSRKDSTVVDLEKGEIELIRADTSKVWGVQASGILLVSDPDTFTGANRFVLLQKRAAWVSGGSGKWAPPGGAFNPLKFKGAELELANKVILQGTNLSSIYEVEYEKFYNTNSIPDPLKLDPNNKEHLQLFLASAVQEFKEEVGIDLNSIGDYSVTNIVVTKKDDWNYVTFIISVSPDQKNTIQSNFKKDSESDATVWVPIEDIIFKEGPGKNLWNVAINDKIVSIINSKAAGIIEVYSESKVTEKDIPDSQSITKIIKFIKLLDKDELDLEDLLDVYNKLEINKNDLFKVFIAIGLHTAGKKATKLLRNIENLKSSTINQKIHEILNLRIIELLSSIFEGNVTQRRIELKDIVIASRIIRRFNSLKFKDLKSQTVYRGINLDDTNDSLDMLLSLIQPDSEYFLGRNASTTKSPGIASKFSSGLGVIYKINIPDELSASLEKVSKFPEENEVLITGFIRVDKAVLAYSNVKIGENYFEGEIDDSNMTLVKKLVKYCETEGYGSLKARIDCTLIRE